MDMSKEPNTNQRVAASELFGMFNALRLEGFSETQALQIIAILLSTQNQGGA